MSNVDSLARKEEFYKTVEVTCGLNNLAYEWIAFLKL